MNNGEFKAALRKKSQPFSRVIVGRSESCRRILGKLSLGVKNNIGRRWKGKMRENNLRRANDTTIGQERRKITCR